MTGVRGYWTCQRRDGGEPCRHVNPNRRFLCQRCGKRRPDRKPPAHMSALHVPYEHYERINGGPHCGICGRFPAAGKRHHKDHEHKGVGTPRGLLCFRCNSILRTYVTFEWAVAAVAYLQRVEDRRRAQDG